MESRKGPIISWNRLIDTVDQDILLQYNDPIYLSILQNICWSHISYVDDFILKVA